MPITSNSKPDNWRLKKQRLGTLTANMYLSHPSSTHHTVPAHTLSQLCIGTSGQKSCHDLEDLFQYILRMNGGMVVLRSSLGK